jgi:hypothetical protein
MFKKNIPGPLKERKWKIHNVRQYIIEGINARQNNHNFIR